MKRKPNLSTKDDTVPCFITQCGFVFGSADVKRICSCGRRGWILISISTPKHPDHGIQVYVTKSGKVRITDNFGEWTAPK